MTNSIKYVHVNIVARDWRKLSRFYIDVFGCKPLLPERNLKGEWLEHLTSIQNVSIKGIHLKLPGYQDGPTLEIFEYTPDQTLKSIPDVNSHGFRHVAFHVDNIEEILVMALKNGALKYGNLVKTEIPGVGFIEVIYIKDPEGNIVELQNWKNKR